MNFRKMKGKGGGVSKAVWNFSENSSVLVAPPIPKPWHLPCQGLILQTRNFTGETSGFFPAFINFGLGGFSDFYDSCAM